MVVSYQDIIKAHYIHDVKVFGKVVMVNDGYKTISYRYSCDKIAKTVANKLLNFKGVK